MCQIKDMVVVHYPLGNTQLQHLGRTGKHIATRLLAPVTYSALLVSFGGCQCRDSEDKVAGIKHVVDLVGQSPLYYAHNYFWLSARLVVVDKGYCKARATTS